MAQNLYTYEAVDDMRDRLSGMGYTSIQLREGVLGSGDFVCIAPDEKHYHFIVREVALNEWSSAHTVRRSGKISKALQAEIDEAIRNGAVFA